MVTRIGLLEEDITRDVIGAFFLVYNGLGFGFLERVYSRVMAHELVSRGRQVGLQVPVNVYWKDQVVCTQRLDMLIDERVVVEIKSTLALPLTAKRQTLNYLRATNLQVALLLHFGPEPRFHRIVSSNPPK